MGYKASLARINAGIIEGRQLLLFENRLAVQVLRMTDGGLFNLAINDLAIMNFETLG
jgi:hypothetical protein